MSASTPASSAGVGLAAEDFDKPVLECRSRPLVMLGIVAVSLCQFFDATIANVALPHMRAALGAGADQISWVMTSFIIATAIATPLTGWLSDRLGSRNLFLWATVLFLASSAACGAATTLPAMVMFRTIQGISAAFLGPMAQTAMFDISPPSKQGTSMAIFGMMVMVAPITGPFIGGFLTESLNWRWIFYVNLPLGIPALAILWWGMPSRRIERRTFDLTGFLAIAIGLGMMQLALDRGGHKDWFDSKEIVAEAILALSAFWIFFVHTRSSPHTLFRKELFANPQFMFGMGMMFMMGISVVGLSAVLPMLFQGLYGYSVIDSGLMLAPRGLGVMIASFGIGSLLRKADYRWVIFVGYVVAAGGMWMMTSWTLEMNQRLIYQAIFVQGFGMGMLFSPMQLMAFSTLPAQLRPDGSSMLSLFRSLGGSVGISVIVTLLNTNQQVSHADIGAHVTEQSVPGFDWTGTLDRLGGMGDSVMAMIDGEVNRQAMMISFLDVFQVLAIMMLCFAPLPLLLRKASLSAPMDRQPALD